MRLRNLSSNRDSDSYPVPWTQLTKWGRLEAGENHHPGSRYGLPGTTPRIWDSRSPDRNTELYVPVRYYRGIGQDERSTKAEYGRAVVTVHKIGQAPKRQGLMPFSFGLR
jgi:hypothetical protein